MKLISNKREKTGIIIKQVVQANIEDCYYSNLRNIPKTGYLIKKIDLRYFSIFSVDSINCICQFSRLWIFENLNLLMIKEVHDRIISTHLNYQKIISLLAYNYYWPKIKNTRHRYIQNYHICNHAKAFGDLYNSLF